MAGARSFLYVATFAAACAPALAQGNGPLPAPSPSPVAKAPARCAALGPGAFAVAGSSTCIRVSGYVSAVAGFGPGPKQLVDGSNPFGDAFANGIGTRLGGRIEVRSDTELGEMRLVVGTGRER